MQGLVSKGPTPSIFCSYYQFSVDKLVNIVFSTALHQQLFVFFAIQWLFSEVENDILCFGMMLSKIFLNI